MSFSELQYNQAALPQLRIMEDTYRRDDSIISTKTADSGYGSDPDALVSPLDFLRPDSCECGSRSCTRRDVLTGTNLDLSASPPSIGLDPSCYSTSLRKNTSLIPSSALGNRKTTPSSKPTVTSNPSSTPCTVLENKLDW